MQIVEKKVTPVKFSNFCFLMVASVLPLFFNPDAQASVTFAKSWRRWQGIPLSQRRTEELLKDAGGRVEYAAKYGDLYVISAVHRTPNGDRYPHITVEIRTPAPNETCHVHVVERHSKYVVHDVTCE